MNFKRFLTLPRICNWLIILFVINTNFKYKYWRDPERIIAWDAISYYAYLPATFIYDDITLKFTDTVSNDVKGKIWYGETPEGQRVIKTSCGLSMLYAPFFFLSHVYALNSSYPANGYSVPYRFGLIVSCIFFFAMGLYFMRKTLLLFFSDRITMLTCFIIAIGTNLFYYSTTEPTVSHAYSFSLIAAFIFFTIKWFDQPSFKYTLCLGLLLGLISLARPTNILIALFFAFWNVKTAEDFRNRIRFFFSNYLHLLLIIGCVLLIWTPQLFYWKTLTNHWLYNSYGTTERFFFSDPMIFKGLFSYRKGWLLYTPVMAFALTGIYFLRKVLPAGFLAILIFMLLNIYIILSWWSWWYGGGFGLRAFIDCYALMAIPLAALLMYIHQKGLIQFLSLTAVLLILVWFNQFQNEQYREGSIHWDAMSKEAYWANFGKLKPVPNFQELLDPLDYEKARQGER
jgi:hypothetical protein